MIVSSTSTSTRPELPGSTEACATSPVKNRAATASSCRTWPNLKVRRNDPNVDGAYGRSNSLPIPPCRNSARSSIESAPAAIPVTSAITFRPGWAPLSVGTLRCSSARSANPADSASATTGTSPAADTRFGSSNTAETAARV
jgi:hypothetical protein